MNVIMADPASRFSAYRRNRPDAYRSNGERELVKIIYLLKAQLSHDQAVLAQALSELRARPKL